MADLTAQTTVEEQVTAVLSAHGSTRPPMLSFSYQGLAEPVELWNVLQQLGWEIPSRPSPPASAIEWANDAEGNSIHTLRPWRVEQFRVAAGQWRGEDRQAALADTIATLDVFDVAFETDPPELRRLSAPTAPRPLPESASESGPAPKPTAATDVPGVLMLFASVPDGSLSSVRLYDTVMAPGSATLQWGETVETIDQLAPDGPSMEELASKIHSGWIVDVPPVPLPGANQPDRCDLRVIVPDAHSDSGLVARLTRLMGDRIEATVLRPIEPAKGTPRLGLLLAGDVEANRLETVSQILAEKYPGIICRGGTAQ